MLLQFLRARSQRHRVKEERFLSLFETYEGRELVCFDCETTGLDPQTAEIISLAAIKICDNRILTSDVLEMVIRPQGEVSEESIKIHQLRNIDVKRGIDIKQAMERFLDFIGRRTLVGYFLEFDVAMVNKYVDPLFGVRLPNKQVEVSAVYHDLKIGLIPRKRLDLRFNTMMRELDLPVMGKHDAYNDALMTAMMYVKLDSMLDHRLTGTFRERVHYGPILPG
jgi:DNA polymerase III subunit epsilon